MCKFSLCVMLVCRCMYLRLSKWKGGKNGISEGDVFAPSSLFFALLKKRARPTNQPLQACALSDVLLTRSPIGHFYPLLIMYIYEYTYTKSKTHPQGKSEI